MWNIKKYYEKLRKKRNIIHKINRKKANWTGHVLRRNCLLRQVIEGEDEEEDVISYCMTLGKREDIVFWKRKN